MQMPAPDPAIIQRRREIADALRAIVPDGVIASEAGMKVYETDGLTAYHQQPLVVVLPETTRQVSAILRYCHRNMIKVVPRGAGTGLSGGALPLADAVLVGLGRMNRIREIDLDNRVAIVEPGVTNLAITRAVEAQGFYYAPDPSSQIACTIGGNIAENSGGVHCLKYGLTTHNVLGIEIVLMDGEIMRMGGGSGVAQGLDFLGIVIGSEGLLGIVTEATVRLLPRPQAVTAMLIGFDSVDGAATCVGRMIASGIIPAGLEMMDRVAIGAAEAFAKVGYPLDVEALLIVELDGMEVECREAAAAVTAIAQDNGATVIRTAENEDQRNNYWAGRKSAFPAVGRLAPDYYCMDGTIPRRRLPEILREIGALSQRFGLGVANVFHAGDGNLHPLILYDANTPGEFERAEAFGSEILRACLKVGGVLTGEHGVGIEKRDLMPEMFTDTDLKHQQRIKCAFDDKQLLNPGKVFPQLHRCAELGRVHVHRGEQRFPDIPRF